MRKSDSELIIRYMNYDDIKAVHELECLSFKTPWPPSAFEDELKNEVAVYLVAEIGNEIAGYVGSWVFLGECHINNIATAPSYRGMGIARRMLLKLMSIAYKKGALGMTLEVREHNEPAKKLYEKLNFTYAGKRKKYYSDTGEDAYVMWNNDILATIVLNGGNKA